MLEFLHDSEFWTLVSAVVVIVILWKPVKRWLMGSLDARAERIGAELGEARKLREEAEQTLAEYQQMEREAVAEAEAILAHARAEAERGVEEAARELEEALVRRRRLAEERIAQAEARAVSEIRAVAVDRAVAAAREALAQGLDEAHGAALIDEAVAALPTQLQ